MPLTEGQVPWTERYGLPSGPLRSKGPTAEACKRFFGRLGYIEWGDYDQHWNLMLGEAMATYKGKHGLPKDPSYGPLIWAVMRKQLVPKGRPNAGEYCFDFYARKLIQDEAGATSESDEQAQVQYFIRQYWLKAIANNPAYSYSQARPFKVNMDPSASNAIGDCSATPVQALAYAARMSKIATQDPSKFNFNGYGNTDMYEDDWPKIGAPYRIGDLAHFHSPRHVAQCIKEGNIDTAEWGSHGWEGSPELMRLRSYNRYPHEFMFVVRPRLLAEEEV